MRLVKVTAHSFFYRQKNFYILIREVVGLLIQNLLDICQLKSLVLV